MKVTNPCNKFEPRPGTLECAVCGWKFDDHEVSKPQIPYGKLDAPTWQEMLPILLESVEGAGPAELRRTRAQQVLERMAQCADAWNAHGCD